MIALEVQQSPSQANWKALGSGMWISYGENHAVKNVGLTTKSPRFSHFVDHFGMQSRESQSHCVSWGQPYSRAQYTIAMLRVSKWVLQSRPIPGLRTPGIGNVMTNWSGLQSEIDMTRRLPKPALQSKVGEVMATKASPKAPHQSRHHLLIIVGR